MKKKILLIDGMALLFRGYFATAYRNNFMKTSSGLPTNGVYQFLRYFLDAEQTFEPSHIVCCWDMGSKTFRTEMYNAYKANRSEPPEELVPQFQLAKDVVEIFNMPNVGLENYEADDCIGTLANQYAPANEVTILTGDHDMLQLVTDSVHVAIMKKGLGNYDLFTMENFYDKKGIHPWQVVDLKGLTGDSADNYPGVKGIGEKTAVKLLQEHDSIDNLLQNLDQLSENMQKRIKSNLEMLHLSRTLAEIKCDIPISCSLEKAAWTLDKNRIKEQFAALNYENLAKLI
ncbi:5'-3' exonuclease [Virgibacillus sp. W0181]|uniref:5'-3' exonuclease n=1 Tax=Virgibacillus sp. W0181 TaxID=3391581 RepID=UPI003F46E00A